MTRPYVSATREESARRTKAMIIEAARDLFLTRGYAATSMAAIAAQGSVTPQTVYNAFGSKARLLKQLYDVTLAGDDEPVPLAQRPEVQQAYAITDPRTFLLAYARLGMRLQERLGPLLRMIQAGAYGGDPDLVAHLETVSNEHLTGVTMVVRRLEQLGPLRCPATEARDVIVTLTGVAVWDALTRQRGWTAERYAAWVGRAMADAVLA